MQLVEQHVIGKYDPRYSVIDEAAFKSKNLYNAALYETRQAFIHEGKYLNYHEINRRMKQHEAYKALPRKVSQQVLILLEKNWKSFKEAKKAYEENPSKFTGRPRLPKYKHKTEGRNILVYTIQAISKRGLKRGLIQPSMLPITIKTRVTDIDQVRIVPRKGFYVIEVVYEKAVKQAPVNPTYYAGIDIGMHNLIALTSNKPAFRAVVVNGRPVKSTNQFYKAELVGITVKITEESYTSKASFLDRDLLPVRKPNDETKHTFSGKRVERGLYRASNGRYINADINGAGNIIRKVAPDAFGSEGVEDFVVHPVRITLAK